MKKIKYSLIILLGFTSFLASAPKARSDYKNYDTDVYFFKCPDGRWKHDVSKDGHSHIRWALKRTITGRNGAERNEYNSCRKKYD
jgi:hypothetical protein